MSNLRIVLMNGGLGNQMYQYTFLRYIEHFTGEKCYVDDSAFCLGDHVEHNGYELEKIFGVKLNLLSRYFSEDVWNEMIKNRLNGISIPQQLLDSGMDIFMAAEAADYSFDGNVVNFNCQYTDKGMAYALANINGKVYYHGYFVNVGYFNTIKSIIRSELVFPEIKTVEGLDSKNILYEELIKTTNSVGVHIRRGDFLKCGRALSPDKYAHSIETYEQKNDNLTYFIFSDDAEWCMEHKTELGLDRIKGEVYFVNENCNNGFNYVDMQLMSKCKKLIISNSSFGAWAYLLNTTPGLEVIQAELS